MPQIVLVALLKRAYLAARVGRKIFTSPKARKGWSYFAGTTGLPVFMDAAFHGRDKSFEEYIDSLKEMDASRVTNALVNAGLGLGGVGALRAGHTYSGAGMMAMAPGKDILLGLGAPTSKLPEFMDRIGRGSFADWATAGVALAALPLAYKALRDHDNRQKEILNKERRNTIVGSGGVAKVALPPAAPGLPHTVVELPIERVNLSNSLVEKLGRDVRRKLRRGVDARTYTRDPVTDDLITAEPYLRAAETQ